MKYHVVLVFLSLTVNMFHPVSKASIAEVEQKNVYWDRDKSILIFKKTLFKSLSSYTCRQKLSFYGPLNL